MTERQSIILGALLHDIGKFQWRANPTTSGLDHETLGEAFIKTSFKNFSFLDGEKQLLRLAELSKRSNSSIKNADIHSAAGEREQDDSSQTRRPLISIFSRISIGKAERPEGIFYYKPEPIGLNSIEPQYIQGAEISKWKPDEDEIIKEHKQSYESFKNDVSLLSSIKDFGCFFTSFYSVIEKWTSRVCSAGYYSIPDISLFDHSRVVAALADCYEESDSEKECLLIKGDISGIQNFIFNNIHSVESAAKILRGRSFFIKLLSEAIVSYILEQLDSTEVNIFYNSGGHFVLIVPNNKKNLDILKNTEKNICNILFDKFEENLQVVIAHHCDTGKKVQADFDTVLQNLDDNLAYEKKRKSFSIIGEIMSELLPEDLPLDNDLFEGWGTELPKTDFLIEIKANKINENFGSRLVSFKAFGLFYLLSDASNLSNNLKKLETEQVRSVKIINLKNSDFKIMTEIGRTSKLPVAYTFSFLGSYIPKASDEKRPMTFEELADLDSEAKTTLSYPALGFLRMDVDSLGKVFRFGLDNTKKYNASSKLYTMSRAASLSRELNLFFSMQIRHLAKENKVYLVYSGGDDLFAVSSWKNIIIFSQRVYKAFCNFVCNNKNITLSAGTLFVNSTYPIARAAQIAGSNLDSAKHTDIKIKDRIHIYNRNVKWDRLENLLHIAKKIHEILEDNNLNKNEKLSRSSLYTLLTLTKKCINSDGSLNVGAVSRTIANIHYLFARNGVDAKEIENKKLGYKTTLAEFFLKRTNEQRNWYEDFIIPASYVLMLTRVLKNK